MDFVTPQGGSMNDLGAQESLQMELVIIKYNTFIQREL